MGVLLFDVKKMSVFFLSLFLCSVLSMWLML